MCRRWRRLADEARLTTCKVCIDTSKLADDDDVRLRYPAAIDTAGSGSGSAAGLLRSRRRGKISKKGADLHRHSIVCHKTRRAPSPPACSTWGGRKVERSVDNAAITVTQGKGWSARINKSTKKNPPPPPWPLLQTRVGVFIVWNLHQGLIWGPKPPFWRNWRLPPTDVPAHVAPLPATKKGVPGATL